MLFRPHDDEKKAEKWCAAISTWFALFESLISNLDKSAENISEYCYQVFCFLGITPLKPEI